MNLITTDELKNKIINKETFLLDLFATWCGPCKVMMRNLENVEPNFNRINFYKLDIDTDTEFVIHELNIKSVPTLILFKDGEQISFKVGAMSTTELNDLIEEYYGKNN